MVVKFGLNGIPFNSQGVRNSTYIQNNFYGNTSGNIGNCCGFGGYSGSCFGFGYPTYPTMGMGYYGGSCFGGNPYFGGCEPEMPSWMKWSVIGGLGTSLIGGIFRAFSKDKA